MSTWFSKRKASVRDAGVTSSEYALLLVFVFLAIVTAASVLGLKIAGAFDGFTSKLP